MIRRGTDLTLFCMFFQFLSVIRLICSCILLDNLQVSAVPASSRVGPGGQVLNVKHRMYKVWRPATNLLSPPPPPTPIPTSPPPLNFDSVLSELKTVDVIWAGCWLHFSLQRKFGEVFTITETVPASAFSWLKVPTSALTFKALIRHYAKQVQTSAVQWPVCHDHNCCCLIEK